MNEARSTNLRYVVVDNERFWKSSSVAKFLLESAENKPPAVKTILEQLALEFLRHQEGT